MTDLKHSIVYTSTAKVMTKIKMYNIYCNKYLCKYEVFNTRTVVAVW